MHIQTPNYRRGERIADRCVHYAGLIAGPVGAVVLVVAAAERERALTIVSVAIYGIGLLGMLGASALYNLAEPSRRKEWFRRLDHAAIFLMIAGSYTPFTLVRMGGGWGHGIAIFVWLVAVTGIALKLLYPRQLRAPLDPALSGTRLGDSGGDRAAVRRRPLAGHRHARHRRPALQLRRRLPPLAPAALSQRHLARVRPGGYRMPMGRRPRRRRAGRLTGKMPSGQPDARTLLPRMTWWMKRSFSMTGGTSTNG